MNQESETIIKELPFRQLFLLSLATSPLISAITVSPVLIVSGVSILNYLLVILIVSVIIFVAWSLNIGFIFLIRKNWIMRWYRIFLVSAIMIMVGYFLTNIIRPESFIRINHFGLMRIINLLCVNTIIFIIIDLILARYKQRVLDLENTRLKLANLEAQYKLLKDQINPHFLFNALGTVKALVHREPDAAEKYIVTLGEFLRSNINTNRELVTIREELLQCENYLKLQKIRFQDSLSIEYTLPEECLHYYLPGFSLVTLAENAIKHNAFSIQSPLKIKLHWRDGFVLFKNNLAVKNFPEATSKTGLKNLNQRFRLLTGENILILQDKEEFCVKLKTLPECV